jgi:4-hydroxybenzoate polyprenyltransferase
MYTMHGRSIMLATKPGMLPDFKLMGLFTLISLLVHISCCASNDLIDLEYDRKVSLLNHIHVIIYSL